MNVCERLRFLRGELEIRSKPSEGVHRTLVTPRARAGAPAVALHGVPNDPAAGAPAPGSDDRRSAGKRSAIRVLLADDHRILREGLASLLEEEEDIEVIGEASDGVMAVEMAMRMRPDVVVMDVTMPKMSGIEATRQITRKLPSVRVIGLSMHSEADMAAALRDAGAAQYLTKGGPSEALVQAIRATAG